MNDETIDEGKNGSANEGVPEPRPTEDLTDAPPPSEPEPPAGRRGHLQLVVGRRSGGNRKVRRDEPADEAMAELKETIRECEEGMKAGERLESFALVMVTSRGARMHHTYALDFADEDALLATMVKSQLSLAMDLLDSEDDGPDDDGPDGPDDGERVGGGGS